MYLKELTINGFKSFAKKGELEFSAQVTGIVGPNGSGKSNVAEAFRFVLGEQSVKSMRGKKGEDLIFSGTDKIARTNRASVSVVMDNTSKTFPVDFDEVIIERTVHRDGSNEYSINGSRVRLKDVQELLASVNIGSTGHHIISQGEADRILTASAKERREMIEDALGLKIYQYKKAESERKLLKTVENIAQVTLLRKEAAPHLNFLERQIKKIEKSLALQEELKNVYAEYLKREDTYIAFHHDRLKSERELPAKTLTNKKKEIVELKEALDREETKDERRDELVALEADISKLRSQRQELLRKSGQIEGQISYIKRQIEDKQNRKTTKDILVPFVKIESVLGTVTDDAEKALGKNEEAVLRRTLTDLVHVLRKFVKDLAEGNVAPDTKSEEKELKDLQKEKDKIDSDLSIFDTQEEKLQAQSTELKTTLEASSVESREAERQLFAAMNEVRIAETEINRIDRELDALERDREDFKQELQEAVTLLGRAVSDYYNHIIGGGEKPLPVEVIASEDRQKQRERRRELEKMKIRLEELGIGATKDIEKEYKDAKERDEFLEKEVADLEASVEKLESLIAELTIELNEQFSAGIEKIGVEFKKFFTLMFGGGDASLKKVIPKPRKKTDEEGEIFDEEEEGPIEEGIELDVQLPNKRVRGLDMLSGGERALTSIALIFAMSQVNPPPFIILDETDAALDEANSRRYGDMITALSERSQLILITHNRETMSRAGILYGVTMGGDGVSKLLSVKFDEAVVVAK